MTETWRAETPGVTAWDGGAVTGAKALGGLEDDDYKPNILGDGDLALPPPSGGLVDAVNSTTNNNIIGSASAAIFENGPSLGTPASIGSDSASGLMLSQPSVLITAALTPEEGRLPASAFVGVASDAAITASAPDDPATTTDTIAPLALPVPASAGLHINLIADANNVNAPAGWAAAVQQAASIIEQNFSDPVTINLRYGYASFNNVVDPTLLHGGTFASGAYANSDAGTTASYSTVKGWLLTDRLTTDDFNSYNALPNSSASLPGGANNFYVPNGELRALGQLANNATVDGAAAFGADVPLNDLVPVALHELTHAIGRLTLHYTPGSLPVIADLFRFDATGHFQWTEGNSSASPSYFSIDNGATRIADFGQTSDYSDFLNSGVQGGIDPFNEFYSDSTLHSLTTADLRELDVIGFNRAGNTDTTPPSLVHDGTLAITVGKTATIPSSVLQFTDNVSSDAQETYSIVTLPANGTLLKNGSAVSGTTTFTQADIDNGLISYHETASGVTSDSFVFKVTDAAGNSTTAQQFQFSISPPLPPPPSGLALSAASDSGIQGDNVTDVKTPVITGLGVAGDTVTLDDGSTVLGSAIVAGNGGWSITTPPLALGAHNLTATETDGLGNTSVASAPLSLAIVQSAATSDVNGDGMSDLLFQSTNGLVGVWELNGFNMIGSGSPQNPGPSWQAIATGDFNADGMSDTVLQNTDGTVGVWLMSGVNMIGAGVVSKPAPTWHAIGTGDFNGDGKSDILLQNDSGSVGIWEMSGVNMIGAGIVSNPAPTWHAIGTGDFNGDGLSDILLQNTDGTVGIWEVSGTNMIGAGVVENPGPSWHAIGTGDFNGDGKSDILLQNNDGSVGIWEMNGSNIIAAGNTQNPGPSWHAIGTGDFNGDGKSDILLQNDSGLVGIWEMNGLNVIASGNPLMNFHFLT